MTPVRPSAGPLVYSPDTSKTLWVENRFSFRATHILYQREKRSWRDSSHSVERTPPYAPNKMRIDLMSLWRVCTRTISLRGMLQKWSKLKFIFACGFKRHLVTLGHSVAYHRSYGDRRINLLERSDFIHKNPATYLMPI
jgi:hypothetical protein